MENFEKNISDVPAEIKNKKSAVREIVEWIVCFFAAFVVASIIRYFLCTPTLVRQGSMTPTILNGERVLINRTVRTFNLPLYRGDIVTFEMPIGHDNGKAIYDDGEGFWYFLAHDIFETAKISYIKRVIGLGGDHVLIKNGRVYVNDQKLSEVYIDDTETPVTGEYYDVIVPEGYIFVMGDNRDGSSDSREFGCIPLEKIEGRVKTRLLPLSKFGKIDK